MVTTGMAMNLLNEKKGVKVMAKKRLDLSTVVDKRDPQKVSISGAELKKLLCEAWDLGCMTGRGQECESAKEQLDDCMRLLRDKYKTLKVEVEYAD
jgi:hypothetical protein